MTEREMHEDEKHPHIDLNNLDKGLIKFCLECGKMDPNVKSTLPKRDPADYKWLRMVYDSIEDDAKHMARLLTDTAKYIALSEEEKNESVQEKEVETLEELFDLVENIENANDLITLGGIPALLDLLRDCTRPRVCSASCGVVAAIMANNPRGQQTLLSSGALSFLLAALETFQQQATSTGSNDDLIKAEARVLSAVSSLVRELPPAQKEFIEKGGMELLHKIQDQESPLLVMRVVSALWRFSTTKENVEVLVKEGFISDLINYLLSDDSSENLRERAADILANACAYDSAKVIVSPHKIEIITLAVSVKKNDPSGALAEYLHTLSTLI